MVRLLIHYCLIFDMKCNSTYITFHCKKTKKKQVMKFEGKKNAYFIFKKYLKISVINI
jgi:hypothetical protein